VQIEVVELVTLVAPSASVDTVGVKDPLKIPELGRLEMLTDEGVSAPAIGEVASSEPATTKAPTSADLKNRAPSGRFMTIEPFQRIFQTITLIGRIRRSLTNDPLTLAKVR
jgi:hypothetical protein